MGMVSLNSTTKCHNTAVSNQRGIDDQMVHPVYCLFHKTRSSTTFFYINTLYRPDRYIYTDYLYRKKMSTVINKRKRTRFHTYYQPNSSSSNIPMRVPKTPTECKCVYEHYIVLQEIDYNLFNPNNGKKEDKLVFPGKLQSSIGKLR